MCQIKSNGTHGKCKLWWNRECDLGVCLEMGLAFLQITPERGVAAEYCVQYVKDGKGENIGFRLEKFVNHPEDAATVYHIMFHGNSPLGWSCDCPDSQYRGQQQCKHRRCLINCLRVAGLLPAAAKPAPVAATVPALEDL